ncbi:HAD-IC family P-type ATPase [Curtobacterium sp. PhB115]|uniref:cation-translocating P-type ATPase n=1 Tax=Curtobacterium sp. PhB115 TaxID=2485173 RepID=UPI000F4CF563|nr:HAD-IC family P-type ATPase [Curtobacterium sp. PhB115]ROP58665.1 Mg2+-importing ATPase [Curtobacterium sp. PhB115]
MTATAPNRPAAPVSIRGLSTADATARLKAGGPNVVGSSTPSLWRIVGTQFRNVVLVLLLSTALLSGVLGQLQDAVVILVILVISVGLGAVSEYRSARVSSAMGDRLRHSARVLRDEQWATVDVRDVVVGDVVRLGVGTVVPGDCVLLTAEELECDESVLTGESRSVPRHVGETALQGAVVVAGAAEAEVRATGTHTEFGGIATGIRSRQPETTFQAGLARFSVLLVWIAVALMILIVVSGLAFSRPLLTTILFALAIAVGVTPQLLPAVVSTALAAGARVLKRSDVLVKRLVCVEDLGGVDVLVTDKTGTLTSGGLRFRSAVGQDGLPDDRVLAAAVATVPEDLAGEGAASSIADVLDRAVFDTAERVKLQTGTALATRPFDHERMYSSALVEQPDGSHTLIMKGAPDVVVPRCRNVSDGATAYLRELLEAGHRVLAVGAAAVDDTVTTADPDSVNAPFVLLGFVVFEDPPRPGVADAIAELRGLGVRVIVVTGDDPIVAGELARSVGIPVNRPLLGSDLHAAAGSPSALAEQVLAAGVVARVRPADKADIVRALRAAGNTVAFLGDGVNDALALHAADVGISVLSATDVARDAADVVLLDKSLAAVATAIRTGRRVFANTLKYVMMGTSSNIGNMLSAAVAASFLPFLPMLPAQVLLNNLIYDLGQLTIPTDRVDAERLVAPSRWDLGAVRRFMLTFGPVSSLFDFITFAVLIGVVHASPAEFRTVWFVESLLTQSLVVFVIRTNRVPSWRSRPGLWLTIGALGSAAIAIALPLSPLGAVVAFAPLPWPLLLTIGAIAASYLALAEVLKALLFRYVFRPPSTAHRSAHHVRRAAARFGATR